MGRRTQWRSVNAYRAPMQLGDTMGAAAANAAWCDAVSRAHGVTGRVASGAWVAGRRTPALYPDAVTLAPGVDPAEVVALVEPGPGCSVKDSFADLDLAPFGFAVLFEAVWWSTPSSDRPVTDSPWAIVRSPDRLAQWEKAWRRAPSGQGAGPSPTFPPALLAEGDVAFAGRPAPGGDTFDAGFALSAGPSALALTNWWSASADLAAVVTAALDLARDWRPGLPVTTYVTADGAPLLAAAGFAPLGPLRVWLA